MRLGKEQAVGYVEDAEAEGLPAQELNRAHADEISPATADESPLTVS